MAHSQLEEGQLEEIVPGALVETNSIRTDQTPVGTVGIPCRDFMNTDTALSIFATDWTGLPVDVLIHKGNVLTMQRNSLIQRMRGDWLLFIDDDMVWEKDAVKRLVQSLKDLQEAGQEPDVLGALCFRRVAPFQPTLYVRHEDGPYRYLEDWEGRYIEVDATGMAFCLITKKCFERVAGTEMPPFEERIKMDKLPDFFRWTGALGEDLRFCQDVRNAGGRIIVDTDIHIGHMAESKRGYKDFLREVTYRDPEEETKVLEFSEEMGLVPPLSRALAKEKLDGLA
jgi:hypothetical protein